MIFPLNLLTVITGQMTSTGGRGKQVSGIVPTIGLL